MANEELNQLIKVARDAAFFIRSIDGYENSKIANDLSSLAEKVEKQKLLAIGRLAARVVYRNSKAAEQLRALDVCPSCAGKGIKQIGVFAETCPACHGAGTRQ